MDGTTIASVAISVGIAAIVVAMWLAWRRIQSAEQYAYIVELVQAAEQMLGDTASGEERLRWVLAKLEERYPKLDSDLVMTLVEAAVYRLNQIQARPASAATGHVSDRQWVNWMNAGAPSQVIGKEARNE